jgi:hypothetical protein
MNRNLVENIYGRSSIVIAHIILIGQQIWPGNSLAYFLTHYYNYSISLHQDKSNKSVICYYFGTNYV